MNRARSRSSSYVMISGRHVLRRKSSNDRTLSALIPVGVSNSARRPITCPCQKLHPAIFMVKSAEDRSCRNLTKSLDGPTGRRILAECQMCPDVVVVGGIGSEDPTQVGFAADDDVIEAFST